MASKVTVTVTVNGRTLSAECEPRRTLADFLRQTLGFTGVHLGCEHGVCGACTIVFNGATARSCCMLAVQADGAEITTVHGLADGETLHPMQEAFWDNHGLQCGFCTPGMLLRACELVEEFPDPTEEQIREGISGNICRCTGYQFIVDAIRDGAQRMRQTS
ncbi:(2Fe-2S)-binding protein (plasmid) [Pseudonocardia bannensis]|uniref:(2Fe-2S)-binding protein n=1 Tax=Pseudonocardia bannensis TaxID=630973 RepID=A0A848DNY1_9PSEU|nr:MULTISPECIES: (2Fe-2S)-binding protein [Pseudonocardia]NMH94176.1 (2Fe-2S)-binding protein [Pseudonocardia bannensis]